MRTSPFRLAAVAGAAALALAACGSDDSSGEDSAAVENAGDDESSDSGGQPTVVVTTDVLGDVVEQLIGDQAEVMTIMEPGSDPHVFQASAQQVNQMSAADALVSNGAGFEEGMLDVIESVEADGVPTFEAISAVTDVIEYGEGEADHEDEDHEDEEQEGEEGEADQGDEDHDSASPEGSDGDHHDDSEQHDGTEDHEEDAHGSVDPHFWLDPVRMAESVRGIAAFLAETLEGIDAAALDVATKDYLAELEALDTDSVEALAVVGPDQRKLVTNHDSYEYFADRYDFDVIGTVIPAGLDTGDATSAAELAELAEVVEAEMVPAIFTDSQSSDDVAQVLADEVGNDVEVVELYTGSLGEEGSGAETYLAMAETNVQRIADALS